MLLYYLTRYGRLHYRRNSAVQFIQTGPPRISQRNLSSVPDHRTPLVGRICRSNIWKGATPDPDPTYLPDVSIPRIPIPDLSTTSNQCHEHGVNAIRSFRSHTPSDPTTGGAPATPTDYLCYQGTYQLPERQRVSQRVIQGRVLRQRRSGERQQYWSE